MSEEALVAGYRFPDDESVMRRALLIAQQGRGYVEPNPMVGAVIVDQERRLIAEGWHEQFGSDHAEISAIRQAKGDTNGRRLFVSLEPCSHHGKTPPCARAVIDAGFTDVVIGCQDPAEHVCGKGVALLREAGVAVATGMCEQEARDLIAPFAMLQLHKRPWVHAKWAMTLDGRIASRTGHSQWITGEHSRAEVHRLRGLVDAIITGAGTVRADDPELTARPPGSRVPARIVLDHDSSSIQETSRLVKTLSVAPVLVCVASDQVDVARERLRALGVDVLPLPRGESGRLCVRSLLNELGRRQMTNVLVEAGGEVLGTFFSARLIDEVHTFVAPKIVGGAGALSPVGGIGRDSIPEMSDLVSPSIQCFGDDVLIHGRIRRPASE